MTFVKGQSGNPGGRLNTFKKEFQDLAREKGAVNLALQVLIDAMTKGRLDEKLEAAQYTINQLAGKPTESIEHSGDVTGGFKIVYRNRRAD